MKYARKIHNQLQVYGETAFSAVRIRHYGYDLSPEVMDAKHIRTTTLLKEMLLANPEDAYCLFQLSSSYSMHHEYDKAVQYGEMALDLMRRRDLGDGYFMTAFHTVAHGYYALGRIEDAERTCLEALDLFPTHLDMCHLLADIYFRRKDLERCRDLSHRYLSIYDAWERTPSIMGCFCHTYAKRTDVYFGLACIHFMEQDLETADAYFLKSFDDSDKNMERGENICRFYLEQGVMDQALAWLKIIHETGIYAGKLPGILQHRNNLYLKLGKSYLQQDNRKAAGDCLKKAGYEELTMDEKLEKMLLQTRLFWQEAATDDLLQSLQSLMGLLDMNFNRTIGSFDDLGQIIYDIAEVFCRRQQWTLAETALPLAIQIAPALFKPSSFDALLQHSEPKSNLSY